MIKFRVWSRTLGKYRQLDETSNDQGLGMLFEVKKGIGSNVTSICYSVGDVVEQFTGLKDVNDKEIYVGDIIEYCDQYYEDSMAGAILRETGYIGSVEKNSGAFGILISRIIYTDTSNHYYNAKDFVPFYSFEDPESDTDLKGDIHNNPELLEAEK